MVPAAITALCESSAGLLGSLVDRRRLDRLLGHRLPASAGSWSGPTVASPGARPRAPGPRDRPAYAGRRGSGGTAGSRSRRTAGPRRCRRRARSRCSPGPSGSTCWCSRRAGCRACRSRAGVTSWMPFSSVRAVSRTVARRAAGTSTRPRPVTLSCSSDSGLERDGHRLVELVGDRGVELTARARQGDRAGRADRAPRRAARRSTAGTGPPRPGWRWGGSRAEYDVVPERLVGDRAGDQVVEGEQVLQGRAAADQRVGGVEVGRVELGAPCQLG